jgi:hypothetical protein
VEASVAGLAGGWRGFAITHHVIACRRRMIANDLPPVSDVAARPPLLTETCKGIAQALALS